MARFRLLAGKHVGEDARAEKEPVYGPDGVTPRYERDGKTPLMRHPSRLYRAGQTVETDLDLVARFGANKFQLISGTPNDPKPTPGVRRRPTQPAESPAILDPSNPAVAPGGQVSSGFQAATGIDKETDPDRRTSVSGPLDTSDPERAQRLGADLTGEGADADAAGEGDGEGYSRADLNDLTVSDLKAHAAENEIDLHGAANKDAMVKKILAHQRAQARKAKKESE